MLWHVALPLTSDWLSCMVLKIWRAEQGAHTEYGSSTKKLLPAVCTPSDCLGTGSLSPALPCRARSTAAVSPSQRACLLRSEQP